MIERGFSLPEIEEIMGYAPGAASAWRLQASWLAWQEAQKQTAKSVDYRKYAVRVKGLSRFRSGLGMHNFRSFCLFTIREFEVTSTPVFRRAALTDLEAIVAMLADDILGQKRENTSLPLAQILSGCFCCDRSRPESVSGCCRD